MAVRIALCWRYSTSEYFSMSSLLRRTDLTWALLTKTAQWLGTHFTLSHGIQG